MKILWGGGYANSLPSVVPKVLLAQRTSFFWALHSMMAPESSYLFPGTPCISSANINFVRSVLRIYDKNLNLPSKFNFLIIFFTKKLLLCKHYIPEGKVTANCRRYMDIYIAWLAIYIIGMLKNLFYFLGIKRVAIFFSGRYGLESFCKMTMDYSSLMPTYKINIKTIMKNRLLKIEWDKCVSSF